VGALGIAHGTVSVGTLVAAVTVATYLRLADRLDRLAAGRDEPAASACERYWEVRDSLVTITDPERPRTLPADGTGHLRLEGVRFRYPGAADDVLRGIDLDVRPGETVALAGRDRVRQDHADLAGGPAVDVSGGRITVDGVDVRDLTLADLRTAVATAFEERCCSPRACGRTWRWARRRRPRRTSGRRCGWPRRRTSSRPCRGSGDPDR